jgi:hypothetical protein
MTAIKANRLALEPFRVTRRSLIEDYVGSWYSTAGAKFETLVNLINQTADTYTIALAANNPRVKVSTRRPDLLPFAFRYEMALNNLIQEMDLDQTLQAIVLDAFFCIGVAKVCLADAGQLEIEQDVWFDPGKPWVGRVSADDLIMDLSAKELSKMRFSGDMYRVAFDKVKGEPAFDRKVVKELTPTSKRTLETTTDLARDIAAGNAVDDDELEPMIWLMDIWLPENREVATFAVDTELPPLLVRPWTGNQGGPYKYLVLADTPDNVIPSAPAQNLKGLHDLYNGLYRKMASQARQQKTVVLYPPGGEEDAEHHRLAKNGQYIKCLDPKSIQPVDTGGVNNITAAFSLSVLDIFDRQAGNLKAMAGLGAQSDTVGQEEIIQANVSRKEAKMQARVVQFAAEVCHDLGFILWNDGFLEIPGSLEIGQTGIRVDNSWTPEQRDGQFDQYEFKVEPYSMVYTTPMQKVQKIERVLQQVAPLWPMFQASGATLDVQELIRILADNMDLPEIQRIITFAAQMAQGEGLGGDENTVRQSPITSRETVRRNIPTGGTADSRSSILQQALLGSGQVNQQQGASMARAAV